MNQIVAIARNIEHFDQINRDDIEQMMLNRDKELTLEKLEEIIAPSNEPKQFKQDEEK